MQEFLHSLQKAVPLCDKFLAASGVAVAGTLTLGHLQAAVGLLVGLLTAATLAPRVVIAYLDMRDRLRRHEERKDSDEP